MMKILYLLSYMLIERKNLQYIESNLCVIRINKIAGCFQFVVRRNIALAIHLLARVSMMFKVDHGCNKRSLLFFIQVTFLRFLTFFFTFSTFFYLKKTLSNAKYKYVKIQRKMFLEDDLAMIFIDFGSLRSPYCKISYLLAEEH